MDIFYNMSLDKTSNKNMTDLENFMYLNSIFKSLNVGYAIEFLHDSSRIINVINYIPNHPNSMVTESIKVYFSLIS